MSERISTSMLYSQSIASLQAKQARLAHLQQQLATGQKLLTAKDDPVAAGAAVGLDRALAELERFGANADTVLNRLGLQENALEQAGKVLARVSELTVQANSAGASAADRKTIAAEIASLRDALLDLANGSDGSGRYLFGGTADDRAPFAAAAGGVVYNGDQTQRRVEIGPQMFVADALPGSEVFLRVRTGDGRIDAAAEAGNAGTGVLARSQLADASAWDGGRYRVVFEADAAYRVEDAAGQTVASGEYVAGETIAFAGLQLVVQGEPAEGDAFSIGPAGTRDVFATLDGLIAALESQPTSDAERAAQQNALQTALRDIGTAQGHFIDARASGGAQLALIDTTDALRDAQTLTLESTLSGMRDLDMVEAYSRFTLEKTALEAAQLSFMQMQQLSLFKLIR
ncbi:flagellar hook-associated protein FlgL [Luteimonas huabeiensis]|uniref:flagellar hook-associated protein FlgL n=1 Tax=Luteimonas huabeiensis TaxID=1244513 RepID=UPI00046671D2|nr:flagellar hook-associated protein FlgL [Luteimonas huabeiensis]